MNRFFTNELSEISIIEKYQAHYLSRFLFDPIVKRTSVNFVFAESGLQIYIFVYEAKSTFLTLI